MRILLRPGSRYFCGHAILLGTVVCGVLFGSQSIPALAQASPSPTSSAASPDRLPLTTTSPEAAKLFEEGLRFSYDTHIDQALDKWREASRKDPNFSRAWAYILWLTFDPIEAKN